MNMKNIYCPSCNRPYHEPFMDSTTPIVALACGAEDRCGSCARTHTLHECQVCMDAAIEHLFYKIPHTCPVCNTRLESSDVSRYISCSSDERLFNVCQSCATSHVLNCRECLERLPIGTSRFYPNHLRSQLYRLLKATRRSLMCG